MGGQHQLVLATGDVGPGQGVALVQAHRVQAALADVGILGQGGALDEAVLGDHGQVAVQAAVRLAQHGGHLFTLLQLQQVHDVGALAGAAALVDLVALQAEHPARVGDKQHMVVGGADEQLLHKVLFLGGHAGNAPAAAALHLIGVLGLALDVALVGQGEHALLLGDQVLNVHLAGHMGDLGAAVVAELLLQGGQLFLHDGQHPAVVVQNGGPVGDFAAQVAQFVLDLLDLQTGQAAQRELADGVGLHIVKAELLHDGGLGLGLPAAAVADGVDDLVHNVHGPLQAFQNVGALPGLLQVELGPAADDLILEFHIPLQHGFQGHDLGHAVVQRQQNDAHGVLQLGVAVQVVQHHLGVGFLLQLHHDPHTMAVGLIVQVGDALDALLLHQIGDVLDHAGLVHHVGNFGDDDLVAAVLLFLNFGAAPQGDLAAAGGVGSADAGAAHDDAAGGEIRALDVIHQAGQVDLRVVDEGDAAVHHFAQVVGRNVGGHAHGNAGGAVAQQVGEPAGQNVGLLLGFVKVGVPVDGVLLNVGEQLAGHFAHAGFGVTVGSRGVTVHAAEVALAVHQRVAHTEVLRQTHHGVINRGVAMGVVGTQHRTHRIGGFAVRMLGVVAALVHGVQNAAVHRLQAVPHVGQGTADDDGHGVIQKGGFDLLLHIAHNGFCAAAGNHHIIFVHCLLLGQKRGSQGNPFL